MHILLLKHIYIFTQLHKKHFCFSSVLFAVYYSILIEILGTRYFAIGCNDLLGGRRRFAYNMIGYNIENNK